MRMEVQCAYFVAHDSFRCIYNRHRSNSINVSHKQKWLLFSVIFLIQNSPTYGGSVVLSLKQIQYLLCRLEEWTKEWIGSRKEDGFMVDELMHRWVKG